MAGKMPTGIGGLVVVGCSRRKIVTSQPTAALEVYQGWCIPLLREQLTGAPSMRARVLVLSARHGLITADTPICTYEQAMTPERAVQLRPDCEQTLASHLAGHPSNAALVLAEPLYLEALGPVPIAQVNVLTRPLAAWDVVEQALTDWGWA